MRFQQAFSEDMLSCLLFIMFKQVIQISFHFRVVFLFSRLGCANKRLSFARLIICAPALLVLIGVRVFCLMCVSECVREKKLKTTKLLIRNKYNLWPRHTARHCRPTADTSQKYGMAYRPTSHAILSAGIGCRSYFSADNVTYIVGRQNDDRQLVW